MLEKPSIESILVVGELKSEARSIAITEDVKLETEGADSNLAVLQLEVTKSIDSEVN